MADDDNVIQFAPWKNPNFDDGPEITADVLLEDCMGEYRGVVIIGLDADGDMTVSTNVPDPALLYDITQTAAQNIAMAHLMDVFGANKH